MTRHSTGKIAVDETEAQLRLEALAADLEQSQQLRSPRWREAFTRVCRHVFVPSYFIDDNLGHWPARWRLVDATNPEDRQVWLDAVYSDRTLVTDLKIRRGGTHPVVTSSTTLPSLMMSMLEDLDVTDGMRVLEIGTGTGYHAALLCERLGQDNVTSIDIDSHLVAMARQRLAAHGYHPHLVAGDGEHGVPGQALYDRVIATCSVDRIPYAWVEQTRPRGVILANLRARLMPSALVRLVVRDNGTASGPFLPNRGSFMALRHDPTAPFDYSITQRRGEDPATASSTDLAPATLHDDQRWGFFAELCFPGAAIFAHTVDDSTITEIRSTDGSWAVAGHIPVQGRFPVTQAGPRRLWDDIECAHHEWIRFGQPSWQSLGLTVTPRGQHAWAGNPANVITNSWR
jgi:methyltransferase of ATP-grasp peptide maturase system